MSMKIPVILFCSLLFGCTNTRTTTSNSSHSIKDTTVTAKSDLKQKDIDYSGPATIVYKTKGDYFDKVPVTLSDDKTKIIAYPAPTDIFYKGKFALPTKLSNGYLLDNRGISKNVAFLNISYEEYSKRKEVPLLNEMMEMILDKNPLTEMYNCGNRYTYKDEVTELNEIIANGQLVKFRRIY